MAPILKNSKEPIIGYEICMSYNNTEMFDRNEQIAPFCAQCHRSLEPFPHKMEYTTKQRLPGLRPRKHDFACTFDHRIIVSNAFRNFCEQQGYEHLEYWDFSNDPLHFQLEVTRDLRIDRARSHIKFGKICTDCRRYKAIGGGRGPWTEWKSKQGSVVYEVFEPIPEGFCRSDLSFGRENRWSPKVIVGVETRQKLKASGLSGVHCHPAYGLEPGAEPIAGQDEALQKVRHPKGWIDPNPQVFPKMRHKRVRKQPEE